jgi:nifR3 family TIM-barrel protein
VTTAAVEIDHHQQFQEALDAPQPMLALAPMQDVTDLPFMTLMTRYGDPDFYVTEYFRVHSGYNLSKTILKSITHNPTGRPVSAQLIGKDIPGLVKAARELQQYPVVAVDLNLGCPAPVVYKKCAGGGLLREPDLVDAILGALRDAIDIKFTVKTRIGFDSPDVFERMLSIFAKHSIDLLAVHGRTVKEMYRSEVHYDFIRQAVEAMPCPVLANGNVSSPAKADEVLGMTGARGCMIGRGAIRNPWLFRQIKQKQRGEPMFIPKGQDVLRYIGELYDAVCTPDYSECCQVQRMKKFINFIGIGVDAEGQFLHQVRRTNTKTDFFDVCKRFLDHDRDMFLDQEAAV